MVTAGGADRAVQDASDSWHREGVRVAATRSLLGAAAAGAFAFSVAFDVQSWRDADQFIFARGSVLLVSFGLVFGVIASLFEAGSCSRQAADSPRRLRQVRRLIGLDAVLVWFAGCQWTRVGDPAPVVEVWMLVGSATAAAAVCWLWWAGQVDALEDQLDSV